MADSLQRSLYLARLAEAAERYEDMAMAMKTIADHHNEASTMMSLEQRMLLSTAFINLIDRLKSSMRVTRGSHAANNEEDKVKQTMQFKIEAETRQVCEVVLEIIEKELKKYPEDSEEDQIIQGKVFFLTMMGDYNRYLAEIEAGDAEQLVTDRAAECYAKALDIAKKEISKTDPIRLQLALQYSVFLFEIKNLHHEASKLAKEAFDDAISELDKINEGHYKDSTLIMHSLNANLSLWTRNEVTGEDLET